MLAKNYILTLTHSLEELKTLVAEAYDSPSRLTGRCHPNQNHGVLPGASLQSIPQSIQTPTLGTPHMRLGPGLPLQMPSITCLHPGMPATPLPVSRSPALPRGVRTEQFSITGSPNHIHSGLLA